MSETDVTTEAQIVDVDDLDAFSADFFGEKSRRPLRQGQAEQEPTEEDEVVDTDAQKTDDDLDDSDEADEARS
jgi:hypothetical protein